MVTWARGCVSFVIQFFLNNQIPITFKAEISTFHMKAGIQISFQKLACVGTPEKGILGLWYVRNVSSFLSKFVENPFAFSQETHRSNSRFEIFNVHDINIYFFFHFHNTKLAIIFWEISYQLKCARKNEKIVEHHLGWIYQCV
jgi:hypothetical protein